MPKLKPKTAILRVIDKHTYKDGALFREIREQCIEWGLKSDTVEEYLQMMLEMKQIEEPIIGYIRRKKKIL